MLYHLQSRAADGVWDRFAYAKSMSGIKKILANNGYEVDLKLRAFGVWSGTDAASGRYFEVAVREYRLLY